MAGIAVTSLVPVLHDLDGRQRNRGPERRQTELPGKVSCDILGHRRNSIGSRRNDRSRNEARQTKQNALRCKFGFKRVLDHAMRRVPDI